ncbi:MAG: FHA domain-containing protein [Acidimicrobiales bacterium]
MSSSLLDILKYFLIALIWLFFARVIRAVWVEVRRAPPEAELASPGVRTTKASDTRRDRRHKKQAALRLEIIEPPGRRGRIFDTTDLEGELTVGRSPDCSVHVDGDQFASSMHARVFTQDGRLWVEDLGSTNGTYVNAERIFEPVDLRKGDLVQVGETVFEVSAG